MKKFLSSLVAATLYGTLAVVGVPPAAAAEPITTTWAVQQRTLADDRRYYVQVPSCAPATAAGCVSFMSRPRPVIAFLHHAGGPEDATTAQNWLAWLRYFHNDTIFVFGVGKASAVWDAGICCTSAPVDDVGYLARVVDDVASRSSVDRKRVGLMGASNGGMLAARAACERPTFFTAAASIAGTYAGPCAVGVTRVLQHHGAVDKVVPLDGGTTWVHGYSRTFPSAASLGARMVKGSIFELNVMPGLGHGAPPEVYRDQVLWLIKHFPK